MSLHFNYKIRQRALICKNGLTNNLQHIQNPQTTLFSVDINFLKIYLVCSVDSLETQSSGFWDVAVFQASRLGCSLV